jgi:hypothetical protein
MLTQTDAYAKERLAASHPQPYCMSKNATPSVTTCCNAQPIDTAAEDVQVLLSYISNGTRRMVIPTTMSEREDAHIKGT